MTSVYRQEIAPGIVRGEHFEVLADGKIRCEICPRYCTLQEGQRAFCFVRQAVDGGIALTSYGRSTGFCVDPIEKKPLNHFYPGTPVLSFGTAGCNLGCKFCQNWDISKAREVERLSAVASPDRIAASARDADCMSVAFTYNDPIIFHEYAIDTAKACHSLGLKTVAVTAGYITPRARKDFFGCLDAANIDLKAFTERFYHKLCFAHLQPVLDTLKWVKDETDVWLEVTTLVIPGENDSEDEVARLCDWMTENLGPDVPLHFSAFHPDFKMLDIPRTPPQTLSRAREQARAAGLNFVYTGNVHDVQGQSTRCAQCDHLLIERNWYQLGGWGLKHGACEKCATPLPGHFSDKPGTWGSRRRPLRIV